VKPGDLGDQFASDITDDLRQMFVAKARGQVVAYGRVIELAADEMSASVSGSICSERTMPSVGCGGRRRASCPSTLLISLFSHSAQVYGRNTEGRGSADTPTVLPR